MKERALKQGDKRNCPVPVKCPKTHSMGTNIWQNIWDWFVCVRRVALLGLGCALLF